MDAPFSLECHPPWLIARFAAPQRMLGWPLNRPGRISADTVAWLEVRDADLPLGRDPLAFLDQRLAERGLSGAVGLMTARDIRRHHLARATDGTVTATALATLGLTNGATLTPDGRLKAVMPAAAVGTINLLVALSGPLTEAAMLESLAVAATARTAALLAEGGRIVGTGTDCLILACPDLADGAMFAGLHTPAGAATTRAVYRAIRAARREWELENPHLVAR